MIANFNAIYRNDVVLFDVVLLDPSDYDLDRYYMWYDVKVTSLVNDDISLSNFKFYLFDSNKVAHNPISLRNSLNFTNTNSRFAVFVGFELEADYFYNAPVLGFLYDKQEKIELINLLF